MLKPVDPGLRKGRQKRGFLSVCHITLSSLSLSVLLNLIWNQGCYLNFSKVPTGSVDLYHSINIAQHKLNQTSTNGLLTLFSKFDFAIYCLYSNFGNKMCVLEKLTVTIIKSNFTSLWLWQWEMSSLQKLWCIIRNVRSGMWHSFSLQWNSWLVTAIISSKLPSLQRAFIIIYHVFIPARWCSG